MKTKSFLCVSIFIMTFLISSLVNADSCLKEVELSQLTGRVVTVKDPSYDVDRFGWNLYFSRYPLAIVFAQNENDVVTALNFCRDKKIPFRIRSGGHALEGWSTLDGGIIIDLREMKRIKIDEKKRLAYIQPGVKQGDAVVALGKLGFAIPNGLEKSLGMGGITLGGGIGLSIRQFGLTCDHLVEVEIILASGKIVRATKENKYKDLFFACQGGGGGNFGVVTEFVFSLIPRGKVIRYQVEYPYEMLEIVLDTWQQWAPFQTKRLNSILELLPTNHVIFGIFDGSKKELLKLMKPILDIPERKVTVLEEVSYVDSWLAFASQLFPPTNDKFSSTFAYECLPSDAICIIKNALDCRVNENANFFFLAMGGEMKKISKTETPWWNRDALFYYEWDESWSIDKPEQAGPSFAWVENLRSDLSPYNRGSYVNVPDMTIPDWGNEYYGNNFKKLKKIKEKYDPNNLFTYELQAIPPKE